jgi:hypothetical protein
MRRWIAIFLCALSSRSGVCQEIIWWDTLPNVKVQRIRPEYTDAVLNNPHKGTSTFQRFEGDPLYPTTSWDDSKGPTEFSELKPPLVNKNYPPTRISYCRWLWSVLEPEEGKIRFDIIDNALAAAKKRGQTLSMRTQPFIDEKVPAWYWKTGAKYDEEHFKKTGQKIPDHNDPLYIKHWGNHIRALGKRYDGHPDLESFDMAYGGNWGEGGGNSSDETAAKLMDIYVGAFKKTQLLAMMDTPGGEYVAKKIDRKNIGWRVDCYGDLRKRKGEAPAQLGLNWTHMLDFYPVELVNRGYSERWKTAPVVLETCGTVASWFEGGFDIDRIIHDGYYYHVTAFMPKSVRIPDEWMDRIMDFNEKMGYRFFIHNMILPTRIHAGDSIKTDVIIDNRGSAPIYKNYRFALKFKQEKNEWIVPLKQDITTWTPGYTPFTEQLRMPPGLKTGKVFVSCGIINDQQQAVVKFAIKTVDENNWHPLGVMEIVK